MDKKDVDKILPKYIVLVIDSGYDSMRKAAFLPDGHYNVLDKNYWQFTAKSWPELNKYLKKYSKSGRTMLPFRTNLTPFQSKKKV